VSAAQRSLNNVFSGLALDRCSERRNQPDWIAEVLNDEAVAFVVLRDDGQALVNQRKTALRLLDRSERAKNLADAPLSFLGVDDFSRPYFSITLDAQAADAIAAACHADFLDLRRAGLTLPTFQSGLFAYARALSHWQSRTRWCPVCGTRLLLEWSGHRGRCPNPECQAEHYPRTDPAIIVIVTWRDACLLGRQTSWPKGRYSTLAGFVEPGETLEDAVRREVHEESGVQVVDCDYFSSQPWPFPASLMLGFTARADDPSIQVGEELDDARWFEVDEFVRGLESRKLLLPPPLSVSFRLIEHWLKQASGLDLATLADRSTWG
jgi:NAD+ diphosphatase